jgi:hypothetical protein
VPSTIDHKIGTKYKIVISQIKFKKTIMIFFFYLIYVLLWKLFKVNYFIFGFNIRWKMSTTIHSYSMSSPIQNVWAVKIYQRKIEIHLKKEFLSTLSVVATITTSEEFFPSFLSFSLKLSFHYSMPSRIRRRKELFNSTFSSNFKPKVTFEPETLILTWNCEKVLRWASFKPPCD